MAGFSDFMGAMRFGMGLVSGFSHQAEQQRQASETQQLALLKILKDEEHDIVPIDPGQVQQSGGILGALFGTGGGNTFNIGGRGFQVVKKPPYVPPPSMSSSLMPQTPQASQKTSDLYQLSPPQASETFADISEATPADAQLSPATPLAGASPPIPAHLRDKVASVFSAVQKASEVTGVAPAQLLALGHVESSFNPKASTRANDPRIPPELDAQGYGQLIPATSRRQGVTDPFDLEQNVMGTAKEWKDALAKTGGDVRRAYLEVYNPNDPNRFKAAARLQQLVGQYANAPEVQALSHPTGQQAVQVGPEAAAPSSEDELYRTQNEGTAPGLRYVQNAPSVTDIAPSASEPVLPRVGTPKVSAQGLDEEQLDSIRSTLTSSEAQYRAAEGQVTRPRQRQALTAANNARLVQERDNLIKQAVQANRDVATKERKLLGDTYHMPIPDWVRTPSTVAKFHELMSGFDPDMHTSEVKRIATQRIAQAVQTGDQAEIQKTIPVLTARMASRHFSKADIDEVKEVSGYKAWEAGQQTATTAQATQDVATKQRVAASQKAAPLLQAGDLAGAAQVYAEANVPPTQQPQVLQSWHAQQQTTATAQATQDVATKQRVAASQKATPLLQAGDLAGAAQVYAEANVPLAQQPQVLQNLHTQQQTTAKFAGDPFAHITEGPVKLELANLLGDKGLKPEDYTTLTPPDRAALNRQAEQNVATRKGNEAAVRVQETRQAQRVAPMNERSTHMVHPDYGGSPPGDFSEEKAESLGYVNAPPAVVQEVNKAVESKQLLQKMRVMLVGGPKEVIDPNAKPGETFPGVLAHAQEQSWLARGLSAAGIRKERMEGKDVAQWAAIYEDWRKSLSMSIISRGIGGERGREPSQIEQTYRDVVGSSGLTSWLATSRDEAVKRFDVIEGLLKDRLDMFKGRHQVIQAPTAQAPAEDPLDTYIKKNTTSRPQ